MGDKIREVGKIIWEWVLFILLPPITLILSVEFSKVFFNLKENFWGVFIIVAGVILSILEVMQLVSKTKEVLGIK